METHHYGYYRTRKAVLCVKLTAVFLLVLVPDCVLPLHYECRPSLSEIGIGIANCSNQSLEHVPPNLPHIIKLLDLSNNKLRRLSDNSFVKYERLETLNLTHNSLSNIQSRAFARMKKLRYLDLSHNSLAVIPKHIFQDLPILRTLLLSGNRITAIQPYAFQNVSYLTNLFLAGNHIENIYADSFAGLGRLQRLQLQNNALTQLDTTAMQHFSEDRLREIGLHNNPWYCDCNLRALFEWLHNTSQNRYSLHWGFNESEPVCKGPASLEDLPFSALHSNQFMCKLTMYLPGRNIEVKKGRDAVLTCKYLADPPVPVQWIKDGKLLRIEKSNKYNVVSEGSTMLMNTLYIHKFELEDIGEYQCFTENQLGPAYVSFSVTVEGVDPATLTLPREEETKDDQNRVKNVIIATATIGGVVFVLVVCGILVLLVVRCRRYQKKKSESIRMTFEEQLKANGIIEPKPKSEPMIYDEVPDSTLSLDDDMDEPDSVYDSLQRPRNPSSTNTNTYISFKTEFSEPEDMTQIYSTNRPAKGSDGSQCESTSPLLENISPILVDPHDPFFETLYIPRLNSYTMNYMNSTHHNNMYDVYPPSHAPSRTQTLPHGYLPHNLTMGSPPIMRTQSAHHKSASVGNLGMHPPKKPPRLFQSRETMSLYSQGSQNGDIRENGHHKLTLPKPGTVDQYGTAV